MSEKINILVAEDNHINQVYLTSLLKIWNIDYQVANNGAAAIEQLRKFKFDCILMDLFMPIMDGFEATQIIRNDPEFNEIRNVPIIAVTASIIQEDFDKCTAVGMNAFISKPFREEDLLNIIQNLTGYHVDQEQTNF